MKEIVVISGKGGTGKTSITASLAYLGGEDLIVADCDVDAADMHLLLSPDFGNPEEFYSGELAVINQDVCIQCGKCQEVCRFDAISVVNNQYFVDSLGCEGCGYCARVCPAEAITNERPGVGQVFVSNIRTGSAMVHARLNIGADNSGKLVAKVKKDAKSLAESKNKTAVLVDGSPGLGCPVVSSLSGANFVVLVTESTVSGIHDLKRVYELVEKFGIKAGCIINKADLNPGVTDKIKGFLDASGIVLLSEIPYNESFTKAMTNGKTIVEYDKELGAIISGSWEQIKELCEI
ncbi:4Fe-4S dicluster domain-containing protein [Oceanispirochaeta crateris]|uniref:4Fe-4S dicluster domain-containing protein n=1 Tax=Oceanispirochaeta crateris TaxID=2518645 RepID=A0A5C1QGM1_9SPIO|nr:ATP-binding protein [Oceanispirochaeta crateris]QEN06597.1 4Fe-4S dicluster domain-containing protein [Oceanispirochaeta crateris]